MYPQYNNNVIIKKKEKKNKVVCVYLNESIQDGE
jgi:hypothetical protein